MNITRYVFRKNFIVTSLKFHYGMTQLNKIRGPLVVTSNSS